MKKIILWFALITMMISSVACAASSSLLHPSRAVGVVIIGDSYFRTEGYYKYAKERLMPTDKNVTNYNIFVGDDVQSKYQEYWINKGFLEEQAAQKDDLISFVEYSGYDDVFYIIIKDPVMDTHTYGLFGQNTFFRTSLQINTFLCDKEGIVKSYSISRDGDSKTSELRARQEAFRRGMNEIGDNMRPYLAEVK